MKAHTLVMTAAACAMVLAAQVPQAREGGTPPRLPPAGASAASPISVTGSQASSAVAPSPDLASLTATVDRYCVSCHRSGTSTPATASGVILQNADLGRVAEQGAMWEKVVRKLRMGTMPPGGMPQPDPAAHEALVTFL